MNMVYISFYLDIFYCLLLKFFWGVLSVFSLFSLLFLQSVFRGKNSVVTSLQNLGHGPTQSPSVSSSACLPLTMLSTSAHTAQPHTVTCIVLSVLNALCSLLTFVNSYSAINVWLMQRLSHECFLTFQPGRVSHNYLCLHLT